MNIPKKINHAIKGEIVSYFDYHYHLKPAKGMDYLAGRIVKMFQMMITNSKYYGKSNISRFASLWFKTTNISGHLHEHSVSGFAAFMDSNFYIISFDKSKLIHRLLFKLNKLFIK